MNSLIGVLLCKTSVLFLAGFEIHSLSLILDNLIILCLGVCLFGVIFFGIFCSSSIWLSCFFYQDRNVFSHYFFKVSFYPFHSLFSSGTPIIGLLCGVTLVKQSSLFFIRFFCSSDWKYSTALSSSSDSFFHLIYMIWNPSINFFCWYCILQFYYLFGIF